MRVVAVRALSISDIPPFPPVATHLLQLLNQEQIKIGRIAEAILADPSLTAEILSRANSPLLGCQSQVHTLREALLLLGFTRVHRLALGLVTRGYMRRALKSHAFERVWRHTVASALLAAESARQIGVSSDRAYIGGLLHDIGRMGLLVIGAAQFSSLIRVCDEQPQDMMELERLAFGEDHCEIGRRLVVEWQLPSELAVSTGRHHDIIPGEEPCLRRAVHAGCVLADALGYRVVPAVRKADGGDDLPEQTWAWFEANRETLQERIETELTAFGAASQTPAARREPETGNSRR